MRILLILLSTPVINPALVVRPVVVRIELDVDGDLGGLCFRGILAVKGGRLEDLVLEVGQAVRLPVFVVFLEGLPFDHALPFPMLFEEFEFFLERHVFEIGDRWWDLAVVAAAGGRKPRVVPLDPQGVATQLELVVFATPELCFVCVFVFGNANVILGGRESIETRKTMQRGTKKRNEQGNKKLKNKAIESNRMH